MAMSEKGAKSLVIGGITGASLVVSAGKLATGQAPDMTTIVGGLISGAALYALAGAAPSLAGGIAAIVLVAAVIAHGATLAAIINGATGASGSSGGSSGGGWVGGTGGPVKIN